MTDPHDEARRRTGDQGGDASPPPKAWKSTSLKDQDKALAAPGRG
ncbi:MAG: hypothetical protein ACR2M4_11420 [Actinomycetota bacterium]